MTWSIGATVLLATLPSAPSAGATGFSFGPFGTVTVYAPSRPPEAVVLFVSGDGGWNLGVVGMAERLRSLGALVAGIDIRAYTKALDSSSSCAYPAGDFEELSRALQLRQKLPDYQRPILVGYSSGATLVYAALAGGPPETFAGAVSLGFCPDLDLRKPLCRSRTLVATPRSKGAGYDLGPATGLAVPWMVLQGEVDQVCAPAATRRFLSSVPSGRLYELPRVGHGFAVTRNWEPQFVDAYRRIAARREYPGARSAPDSLGLPLVEVPAGEGPVRDLVAVVLTGDGGWAELDQGVAKALAARGVPTLGWNSLRYFWKARTPDEAARDLGRILDHYLSSWGKRRALLVGYSFGADVLPFLAARLDPKLAERVAAVALLGLSERASFEFHVASWLGGGSDPRYATVPEVARLRTRVLCVRGAGETGSVCGQLHGDQVRALTLPGGHHFDADWERLATAILGAAGEATP